MANLPQSSLMSTFQRGLFAREFPAQPGALFTGLLTKKRISAFNLVDFILGVVNKRMKALHLESKRCQLFFKAFLLFAEAAQLS